MFKKRFLLCALCYAPLALLAQTDIITIDTTTSLPSTSYNYYINAAPGDAGPGIEPGQPYSINFGKGKVIKPTSFTVGQKLYKQLIRPGEITFGGDNNGTLHYWATGEVLDLGAGFKFVYLEPSQMSLGEVPPSLNTGYKDIFGSDENTGGQTSRDNRNIRLIDIINHDGLTTFSPENAAITIVKKGGGGSIRLQAIEEMKYGVPFSRGPSLTIDPEDWKNTNITLDKHVIFREEGSIDPPVAYHEEEDTLQAIVIPLSALGISRDQLFYGISIFPGGSPDSTASVFNVAPGGIYFTSADGLLKSGDDLFKNLSLWLKADKGIVKGAGQDVRGWIDLSGHNRTASSAVNAPQYVRGENGINFNPAISFDQDSRQYFDLSLYAPEILDKNNTIFVVGETSEGSGYNISFYATNAPAGPYANGFGHSSADTLIEFHINENPDGSSGVYVQDGENNGSRTSRNKSNKPKITAVRYEAGKSLILYDNGVPVPSPTAPVDGYSPSHLFIGAHNDPLESSRLYEGKISEVMVFRGDLRDNLNKLHSYLALKYGIPLDEGVDFYSASDGTRIWPLINNTFNEAIAGIGYDEGYRLNQKQSRSAEDGAIVTIGLNDIAIDNQSNTGAFGKDKSYLVWGNNGESADRASMETVKVATTLSAMMEKTWGIQKTGSVDTVEIEFNLEDLGYDSEQGEYRLVVHDNRHRMESGKTYPATYQEGHKVRFKVDFPEGKHYFTLGIANDIPAPGGASSALSLWLKADDAERNNQGFVTHWPDQSGKEHHPTVVNGPEWIDENPHGSVRFGKGSYLDLSQHAQEIFGNDVLNKTVFIVTANQEDGSGTLFYASDGMGAAYDGFGSQNSDIREFHIFSNATPPTLTVSAFSQDHLGTGMMKRQKVKEPDQPLLITAISRLLSNHQHARIYLGQNGTDLSSHGESLEFSNHPVNHVFIGRNGSDNMDRWAENVEIKEIAVFEGDFFHHSPYPTSIHPGNASITTYLSIKYGITPNGTRPTLKGYDFRSADGRVIWPGFSDSTLTKYHNDVAGIGNDPFSALDVRQSRGSLVTIGLGTIAENNSANPFPFEEEGSFLIWGHDTLPVGGEYLEAMDVPTGTKYRAKRRWRVKETGRVGKVTMSIEKVHQMFGFTIQDIDYLQLIISDSKLMAEGSVYAASNFENGTATFNNINLKDGQYFTLGIAHNPGAINNASLHISPNPVSGGDDLRIRSPFETFTSSKYYVVIKDLSGNEVYRQEVNAPTNEITVSTKGLSPGFYIVNLSNGKESASSKILVQ